MRISGRAVLLSTVLLTACTTKVTYKPQLAAGPAKHPEDVVCLYPRKADIPRPYEIIGLVHVGDTGFTVGWEGTLDKVMGKLLETAKEKGADGVQILDLRAPDFMSSIFRVKANLIRFKDSWEMIGISEADFLASLEQHQNTLEQMEGIWGYNGKEPFRIAIKKDTSKPGRDYVGYILSQTSSFQPGRKVLDLTHSPHAGVYTCTYYHPDFTSEQQTVVLEGSAAFSIPIHTRMGNDILTFVKVLPQVSDTRHGAANTNSPAAAVQN